MNPQPTTHNKNFINTIPLIGEAFLFVCVNNSDLDKGDISELHFCGNEANILMAKAPYLGLF